MLCAVCGACDRRVMNLLARLGNDPHQCDLPSFTPNQSRIPTNQSKGTKNTLEDQ